MQRIDLKIEDEQRIIRLNNLKKFFGEKTSTKTINNCIDYFHNMQEYAEALQRQNLILKQKVKSMCNILKNAAENYTDTIETLNKM